MVFFFSPARFCFSHRLEGILEKLEGAGSVVKNKKQIPEMALKSGSPDESQWCDDALPWLCGFSRDSFFLVLTVPNRELFGIG